MATAEILLSLPLLAPEEIYKHQVAEILKAITKSAEKYAYTNTVSVIPRTALKCPYDAICG